VIHQVKENQTIDTIAKEYEVDRNKILAQNLLSIDDIIKV
jgi:LysM repeat protein